MLQYSPELLEAVFIKRLSRFSARVKLQGEEIVTYVPNSGRMRELLTAGARVFVQLNDLPHRTTKYDLLAVDFDGTIVSIDSRIPNKLFPAILTSGIFPELGTIESYRGEVRLGHSRLDYWVKSCEQEWFIETKSVTLVVDGTARFPDAPTERGTRHLQELAAWVQQGGQAATVFMIQREDAVSFQPNDETDPTFGETLRQVVAQGVIAKAFTCQISLQGITILKEIPVCL